VKKKKKGWDRRSQLSCHPASHEGKGEERFHRKKGEEGDGGAILRSSVLRAPEKGRRKRDVKGAAAGTLPSFSFRVRGGQKEKKTRPGTAPRRAIRRNEKEKEAGRGPTPRGSCVRCRRKEEGTFKEGGRGGKRLGPSAFLRPPLTVTRKEKTREERRASCIPARRGEERPSEKKGGKNPEPPLCCRFAPGGRGRGRKKGKRHSCGGRRGEGLYLIISSWKEKKNKRTERGKEREGEVMVNFYLGLSCLFPSRDRLHREKGKKRRIRGEGKGREEGWCRAFPAYFRSSVAGVGR